MITRPSGAWFIVISCFWFLSFLSYIYMNFFKISLVHTFKFLCLWIPQRKMRAIIANWSIVYKWNFMFQVAVKSEYCRVRSNNNLSDVAYRQTTCTLCYNYLVKSHDKPQFRSSPAAEGICLNHTRRNEIVCPTHDNQTTMDYVCSTLSTSKCVQWTACCVSAWECCLSHKQENTSRRAAVGQCPGTWDGWLCWDRSPAGSVVSQACPSFLKYSSADGKSYYTCIFSEVHGPLVVTLRIWHRAILIACLNLWH